MREINLDILMRETLLMALGAAGITGYPVIAGYQQRGQGRVDTGLYYFTIGEHNYGWQGAKTVNVDGELVTQEMQVVEHTYQIQAFVKERDAQYSALDLATKARMAVSSRLFTSTLSRYNVGVQRPTSIRSPYFVNDRDQYEANPSFDFTLSHKRYLTQSVPEAGIDYKIYRV